MKKGSTFFLRGAVAVIGAVILAICIFALPPLWLAAPKEFPNHTYVFYCIILALYLAAIPFYFALYQALLLLGYIDKNKSFSDLSVKALRKIAYSAFAISSVFVASMPFFYIWAENDDAPGLIIVNLFLVLAPFTIGVFAAVLQRLFSETISIKSENELTV